ncbi:NPCBM/NEW2 domain-containing protein [Gimesia aquarii]|uniref:NPCBM/NEW2 domain protein n=1 Tax=Gimesia aquarii TaxID=2527964 RepID=A0A517X142_9PLAN|nr:NPCBM/NEW2 domain-containing protein [Gimesia aquarii]QDU11219.1 NPCBM/NEW2 domain protein [Gimesia aquarii]
MFLKISLSQISRLIPIVGYTLFISICSSALADQIILYDGKKISGEIRSIDSKALTVQVGKSSKKINIFDVTSYDFIQPALPKDLSQLLIDGEKPSYSKGPRSGKVKLRKGFHRFTLPYYHTVGFAKLNISMSGPNIKKAVVPQGMLYRVNDEIRAIHPQNYQIDKEGYRLPITVKKAESSIAYQLMEWKPPKEVKSIHDLMHIPVKKYGTVPRLALLTRRSAIHFGFVYEGLLRITKDGEYTFYIETDKNSKAKFYIGAYPRELTKQAKSKNDSGWRITFSQQGKLTGNITAWTKDEVTFRFQVADKEIDVALKPSALHELWKIQTNKKKNWRADRKDESKTEDSAYVLTKDGNVHRVSGEVIGVKEQNLLFRYQGQEREVSLDRIVGLVLHKNRFKNESSLLLQSVVNLTGASKIPGEVTLDKGSNVIIKMPWGNQLTVSKDNITGIKTVNARSVPLTELVPQSVEQVPFFNQTYPYQVNKSFSGLPLQIGKKVFQKGLCVHSRTKLVYSLGKNFERFHSTIGLQNGSGHLGNVDVTITADGKTIYEKKEFTITTKQEPLSLDITGCETLTLTVDFGKGQNVGDRFVWGDPKLIRATPKELTAVKN